MFSATQKNKLVNLLNSKIDIPIIGEAMEASLLSTLVDTVGASLSKILPANVLSSLNDTSLSANVDSASLTSSLTSNVLSSIAGKIGQGNANVLVSEVVKLVTGAAKSGNSLDTLLK